MMRFFNEKRCKKLSRDSLVQLLFSWIIVTPIEKKNEKRLDYNESPSTSFFFSSSYFAI